MHLIKWGSKKQQRRRWDYSNLTKEELLKKLSAIWGSLTLHHPFLSLPKNAFFFPSVWPSTEYPWALI